MLVLAKPAEVAMITIPGFGQGGFANLIKFTPQQKFGMSQMLGAERHPEWATIIDEDNRELQMGHLGKHMLRKRVVV
jgi:hypothetical protein